MPAQIISEGVFQAVFDSIGMGNTWKVLKGRFWTAFRAWGTVIDIWKSETEEELQEVLEKSESDIAEIKARYREAETAFAKENNLLDTTYGTHFLFMNPGTMMLGALVEPLLDETYRADTRRLMRYTGLGEFGLTPEFVSNWIDDESKIEKQTARATVAGSDGTTQTIDIFSYTDKNDETQNALNALHGLFITENVIKEGAEEEKPFGKKEALELAETIVAAFESQGILGQIEEVGAGIKQVKEQIVTDVVIPSAQTLKLLSEMLSSKNPDQFAQNMQELSKINPSMKSLNPGDFKQNIKDSVEQILNNPQMLQQVKLDLQKEDNISEQEIEAMVFVNARNEFAKNTILLLEDVYESNLALLMEGITEKGLQDMKETDVGKEYAQLIENNIQLLENAIKSLNDLAKKGV